MSIVPRMTCSKTNRSYSRSPRPYISFGGNKGRAPLLLHKGDQFLWDALESQCQRFGIECGDTEIDGWLSDEDALHCCDGVAIHTPGHTLVHFPFGLRIILYSLQETRFSNWA